METERNSLEIGKDSAKNFNTEPMCTLYFVLSTCVHDCTCVIILCFGEGKLCCALLRSSGEVSVFPGSQVNVQWRGVWYEGVVVKIGPHKKLCRVSTYT